MTNEEIADARKRLAESVGAFVVLHRWEGFDAAVALLQPEIERLESGLAQSRELVEIQKARISVLKARVQQHEEVGAAGGPGAWSAGKGAEAWRAERSKAGDCAPPSETDDVR